MKKIAVLASGSGSNLQALIDACGNKTINAEISVVVSNNENAYALQRAREHGIEAVYLSKKNEESKMVSNEVYDEKLMDLLLSKKVDLIVLAGYLPIVSKSMVLKFSNKIINIHPSLIPAFSGKGYYGKKVHEAAVEYGVKISGATVHFVDENIDTGGIILQKSVEVTYEDSADDLATKVLAIEHEILPHAVKLFCEEKILVEEGRVKIID